MTGSSPAPTELPPHLPVEAVTVAVLYARKAPSTHDVARAVRRHCADHYRGCTQQRVGKLLARAAELGWIVQGGDGRNAKWRAAPDSTFTPDLTRLRGAERLMHQRETEPAIQRLRGHGGAG